MNRARHRSTVDSSTPRSAATCLFVPPSAQRSTIFARSARYWAVFPRRAHATSWARSAPVSTSSAACLANRRGVLKPSQPVGCELAPPLRHRLHRHPQLPGSRGIRYPLRTCQDDPGPVSPPLPRTRRPALELSPLILRQHDRHRRKTRHDRRLAVGKHNHHDFRRDTLASRRRQRCAPASSTIGPAGTWGVAKYRRVRRQRRGGRFARHPTPRGGACRDRGRRCRGRQPRRGPLQLSAPARRAPRRSRFLRRGV